MASSPITIATVGTSRITRSFAEAIALVDGIRIGAAFSRDPARAAAAAAAFGAPWACTAWPELLQDPRVDALYIATPNAIHLAQARDALRAGKHVLVEKPAVLSAVDWDELVDLAHNEGLVILEAIRTRYDPGLAAVGSALTRLGTIRRATLRYEKTSSRYADFVAGTVSNVFDPAMGGGALRDLGIYCIHAMLALFGEPLAVRGAAVPLANGVDGFGSILATYPEMIATLHYSKISSPRLPSVIEGENGRLSIDQIAAPRRLELLLDGAHREHLVPAPRTPYDGEIRRFIQTIRNPPSASIDQARTRAALAILERASR
ncbi:Gfo/Idh/MocA family oxidoreductase [Microbacteriaceae bacterium VKM Ac-2855]|nr:Gfo/Idh/MocA family oxidoreductase [Microbacteriaceae bacterium VKM Ac-2855]